ncbi:hypothetical protein FEM03_04455 [Phragmitibacter flavus]|uniref:Addiction module protein n=1 Tax=Phragmitibacter flavus TaxID=2576071 RepID=A0A5R8KIB7_9BACT|nr:addiction module protein [Phragmitibacter flavus]TLD71981.1 hypothetical protein FEM03_04455 [Phragmitibacter flavus]
MSTATLFAEALSLAEDDRVRLIELLNESLGAPSHTENANDIEKTQSDEARQRFEAYSSGEIEAVDGRQLMNDLLARYH